MTNTALFDCNYAIHDEESVWLELYNGEVTFIVDSRFESMLGIESLPFFKLSGDPERTVALAAEECADREPYWVTPCSSKPRKRKKECSIPGDHHFGDDDAYFSRSNAPTAPSTTCNTPIPTRPSLSASEGPPRSAQSDSPCGCCLCHLRPPSGPTVLRSLGGRHDDSSTYCIQFPEHPRITKDTRSSVIHWMWKVAESMRWPSSVFFLAVHAMDSFIWVNPSRALDDETSLPLLSTACLFLGVSTEELHTQSQIAKYFVGQVPNVLGVRHIFLQQLEILTHLRRGLLINRTPTEFFHYYLVRMSSCAATKNCGTNGKRITERFCDALIRQMRLEAGSNAGAYGNEDAFLRSSELGRTVTSLCVAAYQQGVYAVLPASRLVAALFVASFSVLNCGVDICESVGSVSQFCAYIFRLDYLTHVLPVINYLDGFIRTTAANERSLAVRAPLVSRLVRFRAVLPVEERPIGLMPNPLLAPERHCRCPRCVLPSPEQAAAREVARDVYPRTRPIQVTVTYQAPVTTQWAERGIAERSAEGGRVLEGRGEAGGGAVGVFDRIRNYALGGARRLR